jgi:hypothetical protein
MAVLPWNGSKLLLKKVLYHWQQVPNTFCNFYSVKNNKIVNNLTTTHSIEEIVTDVESLALLEFFDVGINKFKNNQFLFHEIIR